MWLLQDWGAESLAATKEGQGVHAARCLAVSYRCIVSGVASYSTGLRMHTSLMVSTARTDGGDTGRTFR